MQEKEVPEVVVKLIVDFCAPQALFRDQLLKATVTFGDTPLFFKNGLRGPREPTGAE